MADEVACRFDLYDSEIPKIEEILRAINAEGKRVDMEQYRQEIVGRFADIGILATVNVWSAKDPSTGAEIPGLYIPEIVLVDRIKPEPFDHDRQSWEVQHDILDIEGGPATIKANGYIGTPSKTVGLST